MLPRGEINRGFARTELLHLNSARSGDTQRSPSYSSPAEQGKRRGRAVHTVRFD